MAALNAKQTACHLPVPISISQCWKYIVQYDSFILSDVFHEGFLLHSRLSMRDWTRSIHIIHKCSYEAFIELRLSSIQSLHHSIATQK